MNPELVSNTHSIGQNCFHLTWTSKYRYPLATSRGMKTVLRNGIIWTAQKHRIKIIEIKVLSDHVHVFVHIPPSMSIAKCVQLLKGGSSHMVRHYFANLQQYKALWSRGYFYRSVGAVTGNVVENYIQNSQGDQAYWKLTSLRETIGLTSVSE